MARGRIVSSTLGRSRKFNALPDHFSKIAYMLTLTHTDSAGRIEADPYAIYGDSFVLDPDASPERIEAALVAMHHVGLIILYDVNGKAFAEFVNFEEHNSTKKEGAPRTPPPSGVLPELLRRGPDHRGPTPDNSGPTPTNSRVAPEERGPTPEGRGPTPEEGGLTPPEVEVEVEVEDEVEGKETLSSPSGDAGEGPDAESTGGEGKVKPQGGEALATRDRQSTRSSAGPTRDEVQQVIDAYNAHRGSLPGAKTLTEPRERKIKPLIRRFGITETVALMAVAASEVSNDPYWKRKRYGLDNLLAGQKLVGKFEAAESRGTTDRQNDTAARYLAALQRSA